MKLTHCLAVVGDVLQHMAAIDDIERFIWAIERHYIPCFIHAGREQVGRRVVVPKDMAESLFETRFRGKMQDLPARSVEKISFPMKIKPDQTVALE